MSEFRTGTQAPHAGLKRSTKLAGCIAVALLAVGTAAGVAACNSAVAGSRQSADAIAEVQGSDAIPDEVRVSASAPVGAAGVADPSQVLAPHLIAAAAAPKTVAADDAIVVAPQRDPIEQRIARQTITVFVAPSTSAAIRGRIPMGKAFEVFATVEGVGCEAGWADVGNHGFACLTRSRPGEKRSLRVLPRMRDRDLLPFYYAKVRASKKARRWKSLAAYNAEADPVDILEKGHDYAFVTRRVYKGKIILIDDRRRVVLEQEVMRYRPARFHGRDLEASPLESEARLAWVSNWPHAPAYSAPSKKAVIVGQRLDYHRELELGEAPIDNDDGRWFSVSDGVFAHEDDVRVFQPASAMPSDVGSDEVWLDIDLAEQTLAVMRGTEPSYVTLISSGLKGPTPRGIFRIHLKQAVGSMQSTPGADDFYNVEAVPFVQYFLGSFALHTAYWHNAFGRPISHGCVNLSPTDANRVFSMTTPALRAGWLHGYETEQHLGTTVQIRKGQAPPRDRRAEVEPVFLGPAQ